MGPIQKIVDGFRKYLGRCVHPALNQETKSRTETDQDRWEAEMDAGRKRARKALRACNGDMIEALDMLCQGKPGYTKSRGDVDPLRFDR